MDDADMCGKDFVGVCVREAIGLGNKRRYWPISGSGRAKRDASKLPISSRFHVVSVRELYLAHHDELIEPPANTS